MSVSLDPKQISPGIALNFGRCTVEVAASEHPRRPWAWRVCWPGEEAEGIGGEAETLLSAQRLAAKTAERVTEILGPRLLI